MRVRPLLTFGALLVLGGAPALAGRAVTDDERAKLVSAVSAQGCSGGKMEFDDGKYEVDDARCNDGKIYDLDFNPSFERVCARGMLSFTAARTRSISCIEASLGEEPPSPPFRSGRDLRPAKYDRAKPSILHRFGGLFDRDPLDVPLILLGPLLPLTGDVQGEDVHVKNCDAPFLEPLFVPK